MSNMNDAMGLCVSYGKRGSQYETEFEPATGTLWAYFNPKDGTPCYSLDLLNDILELPQKQIEQLQHRIDAQVRASLERVTSHPTFQTELGRIERSIKNLERQLSRVRRSDSDSQPQRPARARAARKGPAR